MCNTLRDKFRGCLMGALLGDCIGSYFEGNGLVNKDLLSRHIDRTENNQGEDIFLTDDTQMTQELADSLIEKKCFDAEDLARRFTTRYFYDGMNAGYGYNVVEVFSKLKESDYKEPLRPAREQFGGSGSYGNGAAMRVSPVALLAFPDMKRTAQLADDSATVTHTHERGRHGAVLQALAIRQSMLKSDDSFQYLKDLTADCKEFGLCVEYMDAIEIVKKLLEKENVSDTEVELKLGNGVAAIRSVPTALYCFLRALKPIPDISTSNTFRRTVEFAISLGGDTDTIASMAGALAGASLGLNAINANTVKACPDSDRAVSQADALYSIACEST